MKIKKRLYMILMILSISICGFNIAKTNVYAADSDTVYITKTGNCYHRSNCSSLRRSKIATTLKEAIADHYSPCSNCEPPTGTPSKDGSNSNIVSSKNSKTSNVVSSQNTTSKGNEVWISATGKKYHKKNNCGNMNPSKARLIDESYAQENGYKKCETCYGKNK